MERTLVFVATFFAAAGCGNGGGGNTDADLRADSDVRDGGADALADGDAHPCGAPCGDGLLCDETSGQCRQVTCFDEGCPDGQVCDPATSQCRDVPALEDEPSFDVVRLVNHRSRGTLDGPGQSALASGEGIVVDSSGRNLYWMEERYGTWSFARYDRTTKVVTRVAGGGLAGYVDGPLASARFNVNDYQSGGAALSSDGERYYLLDQQSSGGAIRVIDMAERRVSTLAAGEVGGASGGAKVRALSMGLESGDLYVGGWGGFFKVTQAGEVTPLPVEGGGAVGFLAADEARETLWALNRNSLSGEDPYSIAPLYSWPLAGGEMTVHNAQGRQSDNASSNQYITDGPVAGVVMHCPHDILLGPDGFLYIGGGDSRTFRRFDPDRSWVTSLCFSDEQGYHFCVGDGSSNKDDLFTTWPNRLVFDAFGNGYFQYSVYPMTVMLERRPQ